MKQLTKEWGQRNERRFITPSSFPCPHSFVLFFCESGFMVSLGSCFCPPPCPRGTSSSTIDFGAGITVSAVTVASQTALFADIVIGDAVTPGVRDVIVHGGGDTLTLKSAFEVESPIKVEFKGTLAQGSIATFTVRNLDFENPFDDTCTASSLFGCSEYGNLSVESPPGTSRFRWCMVSSRVASRWRQIRGGGSFQ